MCSVEIAGTEQKRN